MTTNTTLSTYMLTDSKSFSNYITAVVAPLTCSPWVYFNQSLTSIFSFVGKEIKEHAPRGIIDRLSEHTRGKTFDIKVLYVYVGIFIYNTARQFMGKVSSLVMNMLMVLRQKSHRLLTTVRPFLLSTYSTLQHSKFSLCLFKVSRVINKLPIGGNQEAFEAHINPDRSCSAYQGDGVRNITAETDVVLPVLSCYGDSFDLPFDGAVKANIDITNPLKVNLTTFKLASIPVGRKLNSVVPKGGFESWESSLLALLYSTEKGLERLINFAKYRLTGRKVCNATSAVKAYIFKFRSLVVVAYRFSRSLVGTYPMLQGSVIQPTGSSKMLIYSITLATIWVNAVFIGLYHLPILLGFYIFAYNFLRYVTYGADIKGPAPERRHSTTKYLKLLTEFMRSKSLELVGYLSWGHSRVIRGYKKMNMVWHNLHSLYSDSNERSFTGKKLSYASIYLTSKNFKPVFRAPHYVVF